MRNRWNIQTLIAQDTTERMKTDLKLGYRSVPPRPLNPIAA